MFQPRMLVVETDWAKVGQFCKHLGVLETKFDVEEVYTNDLVPMMGKPSVQSVVPGGIFGKKDKRSACHTNDESFSNFYCSFVQFQSPALFNGFLGHLSDNFYHYILLDASTRMPKFRIARLLKVSLTPKSFIIQEHPAFCMEAFA